MDHLRQENCLLRSLLNIPSLGFRRPDTDLKFITSIFDGSLNAFDLVFSIIFGVPTYFSNNYSPFEVPSHATSYGHNQYTRRMLRNANYINLIFHHSSVAQHVQCRLLQLF